MQADHALEEVSGQLREAGLSADIEVSVGERITIRKIGGDPIPLPPPNESIRIYNPEDIDQAWIFHEQDLWLFSYAKEVPGPGPHDLKHVVKTPKEMVAFIVSFFMGTPVTIDRWIIPLHRHPELNEERLRHLIAHAQPPMEQGTREPDLSEERAEARRILRCTPWWDTASQAAWERLRADESVPLESENPSCAETLFVRRDQSEAFLLRDKHCPSCHQEVLVRTGWSLDWQARYLCLRCRQSSHRSFYRIFPPFC